MVGRAAWTWTAVNESGNYFTDGNTYDAGTGEFQDKPDPEKPKDGTPPKEEKKKKCCCPKELKLNPEKAENAESNNKKKITDYFEGMPEEDGNGSSVGPYDKDSYDYPDPQKPGVKKENGERRMGFQFQIIATVEWVEHDTSDADCGMVQKYREKRSKDEKYGEWTTDYLSAGYDPNTNAGKKNGDGKKGIRIKNSDTEYTWMDAPSEVYNPKDKEDTYVEIEFEITVYAARSCRAKCATAEITTTYRLTFSTKDGKYVTPKWEKVK
ncbi:MAG: hypothetical protein DPW14_11160 [Planctomycetes bacterium]|nr:hypothetical protein [Planctomycetota bacterium]